MKIFGKKKKRRNKLLNDADSQPILMEWEILQKVFSHFDYRKKTWETRGSKRKYGIGHYFEFGCYNGDTLVDFFNVLKMHYYQSTLPEYWKMFVFDSFEGLPNTELKEDLHEYAGQGSYKSDGVEFVKSRLKNIGCDEKRLKIIKGFYEKSLTDSLRRSLLKEGIFASFVNIDCDYYSSTMTALNWIEPLLADGSIIYFDDIYFYNCNPNKGEIKAIADFNKDRKDSGLALAAYFDIGHRCYMYWKNDDLKPHYFEFKEYIKG